MSSELYIWEIAIWLNGLPLLLILSSFQFIVNSYTPVINQKEKEKSFHLDGAIIQRYTLDSILNYYPSLFFSVKTFHFLFASLF